MHAEEVYLHPYCLVVTRLDYIDTHTRLGSYLLAYNSRMAQTTQWLQAIQTCMRKVRLKYQQCMASFPAQTAKFSSNCVMTSTFPGVWLHYGQQKPHNSLQPRPLD